MHKANVKTLNYLASCTPAGRAGEIRHYRNEMLYWTNSCREWRSALGRGNKLKSAELKQGAMAGLNRARAEAKRYIELIEHLLNQAKQQRLEKLSHNVNVFVYGYAA